MNDFPLTRRTFSMGSLAVLAAGHASQAAAQRSVPIKVQLNWLKNVEAAPVFAAVEKDFFKAEGLDVDLRGGGPQIDPVALLASGAVDIAFVSSPLPILAARSRGVPLAVIAPATPARPSALLPGPTAVSICRAD